MIKAFYTSGTGAKTYQYALDVVANNVANINSTGYKAQTSKFSDLLYDEQDGGQILVGSGSMITVGRDLSRGNITEVGDGNEFYIAGDGYFAAQDEDGQLYFAKSGKFTVKNDNGGYLTDASGNYVLDAAMNRIGLNEDGSTVSPGLFAVSGGAGAMAVGNGKFIPGEGAAVTVDGTSRVMKKYVELSNVDLAGEMTDMITAQRGYQAMARMIKTADEIEQYANDLTN